MPSQPRLRGAWDCLLDEVLAPKDDTERLHEEIEQRAVAPTGYLVNEQHLRENEQRRREEAERRLAEALAEIDRLEKRRG